MEIVIKGNPTLSHSYVTVKSLFRKWHRDDQGFLVELKQVVVGVESSESSDILFRGEHAGEEAIPT